MHISNGPAQNRHLHRANHMQVTHILSNTTLEDAEALSVYHIVYISGVALFVAAHLHEYKGRGGLARNSTAWHRLESPTQHHRYGLGVGQRRHNNGKTIDVKEYRLEITIPLVIHIALNPMYRMAGNIGGKLTWRLAVETKNAHFISAKFNIVRQCVGVYVRRDYRQVSSSENWQMALF